MTTNQSELDRNIRHDFNACLMVGMSTYAAKGQVAAVYLTTAQAVTESLARTEFELSPRD